MNLFFVYRRGDLFIALNFKAENQRCQLPAAANGRILISTELDREGEFESHSLVLRSNEGMVIRMTGA